MVLYKSHLLPRARLEGTVNIVMHREWLFFPNINTVHNSRLKSIHILSVNEKLPPLKFRYFEKYKISFKHCRFIHDSDQHKIDLETFNSSTSPGTMVHMQTCNL